MTDDTAEPPLSGAALEYERGDPCAVVSLVGQVGITDFGWLRLLLELQAAQGEGRLVVDLSRLSSMDWWVALILNWAGRVISRRGGVLVLASPQPAVARLLDAVGAPRPSAGESVRDSTTGGLVTNHEAADSRSLTEGCGYQSYRDESGPCGRHMPRRGRPAPSR